MRTTRKSRDVRHIGKPHYVETKQQVEQLDKGGAQLIVKTPLFTKVMAIRIGALDTVEDLKRAVIRQYPEAKALLAKSPRYSFRVLLNGTQLDDDCTLSRCGAKSGDKMSVLLRLLGGGGSCCKSATSAAAEAETVVIVPTLSPAPAASPVPAPAASRPESEDFTVVSGPGHWTN